MAKTLAGRMADLALDRHIELEALRGFFSEIAPDLAVRVERSFDDVAFPCDLWVAVEPNSSEFPFGLSVAVATRPGYDLEMWLRGLARALSDHFAARAICDGSPYGDTPSEYWDIIWDHGEAFLGYDLHTAYGDGVGGPVQIVRTLDPGLVDVPAPDKLADWVLRDSER